MAFEINPLNQPLVDSSGLTRLMKQKKIKKETSQFAISLKVAVSVSRSATMFQIIQACCHAVEKVTQTAFSFFLAGYAVCSKVSQH